MQVQLHACSGTCALLDQELRPGSIVVANPGSLGCYTNYAYFDGTAVEYSRAQGRPVERSFELEPCEENLYIKSNVGAQVDLPLASVGRIACGVTEV